MSPANTVSRFRLIASFAFVLIFPVLIIWIAGDWRWTEGWIFFAWFVSFCYSTIIHLYRHDPALLAERYQRLSAPDQESWDPYIVVALFVGFIAWIVIMPIDAKRSAWSPPFPLSLKVVGAVALVASSFFTFRAYADNTFVSPLVRIQKDRHQRVISTGVYGLVRHPMYLGAILLFLGTPLLLGSLAGLGLGLALSLLLMGRIIGEERMLLRELEGYAGYKTRVRYRLIPFIW